MTGGSVSPAVDLMKYIPRKWFDFPSTTEKAEMSPNFQATCHSERRKKTVCSGLNVQVGFGGFQNFIERGSRTGTLCQPICILVVLPSNEPKLDMQTILLEHLNDCVQLLKISLILHSPSIHILPPILLGSCKEARYSRCWAHRQRESRALITARISARWLVYALEIASDTL